MRDARNITGFRRSSSPAGDSELSPYAATLAARATAPATGRAYRADDAGWRRWLAARGLDPTAASLADYIAARAAGGSAVATLRRNLAGCLAAARAEGLALDSGPAAQVLRGAARSGSAGRGRGRARPITVPVLQAMIAALDADDGPDAARDRALLLAGWHGALRASEIVGLRWRCYRDHGALLGVTLTLEQSKGQRDGGAVEVPLVTAAEPRYCPLHALESLARGTGRDPEAHIFRARRGRRPGGPLTAATVSDVVRRYLALADVDDAGYSAHSLRAGYLTAAAAAGVSPHRLMEHSRHKSSKTLDVYVRDIRNLQDHPSLTIGI